MLLVHERLHQLVPGHLLLVHQALDQALLLQQRVDPLQMLLHALGRGAFLGFGHGGLVGRVGRTSKILAAGYHRA
jgi:hypothetical protein